MDGARNFRNYKRAEESMIFINYQFIKYDIGNLILFEGLLFIYQKYKKLQEFIGDSFKCENFKILNFFYGRPVLPELDVLSLVE